VSANEESNQAARKNPGGVDLDGVPLDVDRLGNLLAPAACLPLERRRHLHGGWDRHAADLDGALRILFPWGPSLAWKARSWRERTRTARLNAPRSGEPSSARAAFCT